MISQRDIDVIVGKTILSYNKSHEGLVIQTDAGTLKFYVDGDCCSQSWIESVEAPKLPAKILAVTEVDIGEVIQGTSEQDHVQKYSTTLKTDQGDFEIEYRNESNGYYGGSIHFAGLE